MVEDRKLVEAAFEVTDKCNLNCTHCYNKQNLNKGKELSTKQIFAIIEKLNNFRASKLKIGGGEPLLRPDLFEIYNFAKDKGLETVFATNGLLILENLQKIKDNRVYKLQISLDNIGYLHDRFRNYNGLFEKIENAINWLRKNNIEINIATTLTRENFSNLKEIYTFCKAHGILRWKIMKYIPRNAKDLLLLSPENYEKTIKWLLDLKNKNSGKLEIIVAREFDLINDNLDYNDQQCFGGKSFFSIKSNGDVTPCSYLDSPICGNIVEQSIETIWNHPEMVAFSKDIFDRTCKYSLKCRGGCKAASIYLTGKADCDPYCWAKVKKVVL